MAASRPYYNVHGAFPAAGITDHPGRLAQRKDHPMPMQHPLRPSFWVIVIPTALLYATLVSLGFYTLGGAFGLWGL